MNGYYKNRIKVVCEDMQCFPVHPVTLAPLACGCYDAHAHSDPDPEPVETISVGEWNRRINQRLAAHRARPDWYL